MLSPLTTKEAVLSSRIEGTNATVDEVLEQDAGLVKEGKKFEDIQEISNYRSALYQATKHLETYPIRLGFIREIHKILMSSARGENQAPGEFRIEQNWMGQAGCSIEEASFVPPDPLRLQEFLLAWEEYLSFDDINFLLQTAVVHAQFELLHPFNDGNGRIGRILIPLFLYQKKQLSQPMFYLSEYLEGNREEYYQRLKNISQHGDWNGWVAFFLRAVTYQAIENSNRVVEIMALYESMKVKMHEITHSQYSVYLLDALFSKPIFTTSDCATRLEKQCGIHKQTTLGLLRELKAESVLIELQSGSGSRAAVLGFPGLINVAEGRTVL